ncbi:type II secretion system F family protein [Desulforamulus ruminis]|uniref:Type II secretion system F domain protein n=1 Tax=Desulforamulus ruminis (strain ATCC 23193 / DSM 2154 / NCIMB 8452 / DL) TaxID=696281 RepID=F6DUD6_DESRL|nr:type II secretion system F family protein [Desulforamulus ruminis]AEG61321.1 Type II secretion system F domain protein [Desulforamulus ruminis DSM 2154]
MPFFEFKGRSPEGKAVSGMLEAASASDAVSGIRAQGVFVTDLSEARLEKKPKNSPAFTGRLKITVGGKKVKLKELATFARQLSTLLNAGIPLIHCLNIVSSQTESGVLKGALEQVMTGIEEGNTLADSFAGFPHIFPEVFVFMVRAGELGGVLDEVLERVAEQLEREHDLNEKIKSAMTYPAVVLIFALVALVFLMTFVLPRIIAVIADMGVPLPLPTRAVMVVSGLLTHYWYLLPGLFLCLLLGYKYFRSTPWGRERMDSALLKIPLFGPVYRKVIIARFCRTLGTLLEGGVPIIQALEVVKKSSGNIIVEKAFSKAQESVQDGRELSKPLEECRIFPPMVTRMIAVGEETGALDDLLERIGIYYDKEVSIVVGRLSSVIEPLLIVFLGCIVGFIILAVMLPMISSMSQGLG